MMLPVVFSSRSAVIVLSAAVVLSVSMPAAATTEPLLRFPDVHGDTVVFVHAEDIWTAPAGGGAARRLTDDEGSERHPKFSPDGSLIAFTADMDGNPDVFVMNADGADLRRLTFHPSADEVVGWHPTRNLILFRSSRQSNQRYDRLFLIAPDGGGLEVLPLHEAGRASFSPDGAMIAYNRIAREDRTWKRYFGGMAQDLWLYDLATREDRRLTDYPGTDRLPMWIGDSIYFVSDREGPLEIYRYGSADGTIERITNHKDFDVRRASSGGDRIVYEVGGSLWLLDTATGTTAPIPIDLPTQARETRPFRKEVGGFITHVDIAPEGGRALIVARGEIFSVPAEHGATRNLTGSSAERERNAVWSPDGEHIAYFSDAGGEYQLWVSDPLGDEPRRITSREGGYPHTPRWSPDGSRIAFTDHTLSLFYVDVASGEVVKVDRAEVEPMDVSLEVKPISDFSWSPDGRWLAYSKIGLDHVSNIYLYSLAGASAHNISSGLFNDFGPVFSRDGEHLFFVSNRRFDPTFCDFEWEMVYKNVAGIYALTLRADGDRLLPLRSDEVAAVDDADDDREGPPDSEEEVTVRVDLEGIAERIEALPVPAANYRSLAAGDDAIYFLDGESGDFNRFEYRSLPARSLQAFDLEDREVRTVVSKVDAYNLAANGRHLVWRHGEKVGVVDDGGSAARKRMMMKLAGSGSGHGSKPETLDLDGLVMNLDPRAEWRQVFNEAWRLERDFFYDPSMHGLDWPTMRDKYAPLVERATCAQDLRFIIGELIGELATSHTYVRTGDRRRRAEPVDVGLLGADWATDPATGLWVVEKIFRVPDWSRGTTPPLAGPGIDVLEGDYLVAVNGEPVTAERSLFAYFQGLSGEQVRLRFLRGNPNGNDTREVVVTPVRSERFLRYLDWVEHNRRVVDEASNGTIGYLHLPDTYLGSAVEFPKYFYSQTQKQALLVDGRFNGGGLDPDIFLQRLAKTPLAYWTRRYSQDQATPVYVTNAHLALLTNRQAGSGGDELPLEFRQKGMGPVIGTRTWGGLVGVSMFIRLVDGSGLSAPDYRIYTPEGQWVVENEGVTPDIIVENDPAEMARGHDAQLQKGIEVLLQAIEADPRARPAHPPFPGRR